VSSEFRSLESRLICRTCHAIKFFRMPYQDLYYHHVLKGNNIFTAFDKDLTAEDVKLLENKDVNNVVEITESEDEINNALCDSDEFSTEWEEDE